MLDYRRYDARTVGASRGVLVEVFSLLQQEAGHCVLVGGWAPFFLVARHKPAGAEFDHIGSVDIDVALDCGEMPGLDQVYAGIRQRLERVGYRARQARDGQPLPFSMERETQGTSIHVDFLAPETGGTGAGHRHQRVQDIMAFKARGCEVAFQNHEEFEVEAVMPSRARHTVRVPVAGPAAILTMKAWAFADDPSRIKDAYDICAVLRYYKSGTASVAAEVRPFLGRAVVRDAVARLAALFDAMDSVGPIGLANFRLPEQPDTEDWDLERRTGLETVQLFLRELG
jgi:hypothetical protein